MQKYLFKMSNGNILTFFFTSKPLLFSDLVGRPRPFHTRKGLQSYDYFIDNQSITHQALPKLPLNDANHYMNVTKISRYDSISGFLGADN